MEASYIHKRSFIAKLYAKEDLKYAQERPIAISRGTWLMDMDGWLIQAGNGVQLGPSRFHFKCRGVTSSRVHYDISCADEGPHAGAKVGVSQNGYLGVYQKSSVTDLWKAEELTPWVEGEDLHFVMRDHRGYRVGVTGVGVPSSIDSGQYVPFLSMNGDQILHFRAEIEQVL
ncbi:MAG: hypothetical protein PW845_16580 [Pseudomonas sp.]|nr:hypothetical protein [Pseudomonas sp.]